MATICGIVITAIFQLIIGLASTGCSAYLVYTLANNEVIGSNLALIAFPALWMSIIVFGVTTLFAGIIGLAAGCQRGQCVVLTFMASCVLCCLSSCEVIVIGAFYVINLCTELKECTKGISGIFWLVVLGCSAFVFLISLIGSGLACRARCYCCSSPGDNAEAHDPNLMVLTNTAPTAPTLGQINYTQQY